MLFYISHCSVFFLATLATITGINEKVATETEKSEAIFADVIKNISRVNNVLQELINNYEQLQKIYKSQEAFDTPQYSSETEMERYFKNNKKSNRGKENPNLAKAKTTGNFLHATQMILSEENDKSNDAKSEKANKYKLERTPKVERLQTGNEKPTVKNSINQKKISTEESYSEETKESPITTVKVTPSDVVRPKSPPAEIIFVDTHKKVQEKLEKTKPKIMPEIALEQVTKKLKTRYSVKDTPDNQHFDTEYVLNSAQYLRENLNGSKATPNKYLKMQFMSTNDIWEAITSKPKGLANLKGDSNRKQAELKILNLRSHRSSNKTAKVFVANDVNKSDISSSDMTDDDEDLNKDLFKTSVLRQAYGDACLKLVVRKCYKACKLTLKSSCRAIKCKSDIKSYFKKSYQKGCDQEFEDISGATFRRLRETEGPYIDLTRAGYLSVACLPRANTGMSILSKNETAIPEREPMAQRNMELNILRDKYERACQQASQDKCNVACSYAHNATCTKYECVKSLNRNFKRNCKRQCKMVYQVSKDSGSDYSDDSDSDSSDSDSSD